MHYIQMQVHFAYSHIIISTVWKTSFSDWIPHTLLYYVMLAIIHWLSFIPYRDILMIFTHSVNFSVIPYTVLCSHASSYSSSLYQTWESYTGFFISPSWISELDCAITKTDSAERSISIGRESLQVSVLPYRCSICEPLVTQQMSIL